MKRLKSELLALAKGREKLHAETVVRWAKAHRASALYRQFEWNNSKAAHEYRLWQARRLIMVNIITEAGDPEMVNLTIDRTGGGGYRQIIDVLNSHQLSLIMLNDAIAELERVKMKYGRVRELTRVWLEVRKAKKKASRKKR